jgi:integrase
MEKSASKQNASHPPNLLDHVRGEIRLPHFSLSRKQRYISILRYSFATHLLRNGYDLCTVQEFWEHGHVSTTIVHVHVLNRARLVVRSLVDVC